MVILAGRLAEEPLQLPVGEALFDEIERRIDAWVGGSGLYEHAHGRMFNLVMHLRACG